MTKYTPTTEQVRRIYVKHAAFHGVGKSALHGFSAEAEFDRWLAEHDRQVREKLWDEIVPQYAHDWYWHDGGREQNPHRKEATGD